MNTMLALISNDALLNLLVDVVIWGVIFAVLWWGLKVINPDEPWKKVATVILVLATVIVCINLLLGISGHGNHVSFWR